MSFCSSHTSKRGFLSRFWICCRNYVYTPQRGMEWGGDLSHALHKTKALQWESGSRPPEPRGGRNSRSWGQGESPWPSFGGLGSCTPWPFSWALWEGWGLPGLGGARLTASLPLVTAGFQLPVNLVLSATLTGTAIYQVHLAPAVPFASGPLPPTPKPGTAQAQVSSPKAPPTVLVSCFWTSWEYWLTQAKGGVSSYRARIESEHMFRSHTNMDLNPCSILCLLCDLGQIIRHLWPH